MPLMIGAATPIAVALILLVGLRWPASRAMPVCAALTAIVAATLWTVTPLRIAAAAIEGLFVTASILLIVFGALFFLALLRSTGAIAVLQGSFADLSPDARIQAVLVAWLLGSFLEGAAGFGTPAAITAPLLIGLGFPPVLAVVVALIGDSTAVSFGSVGTPMIIGMGQGLGGADGAPSVDAIAVEVATLDLALGTLMPSLLVMVLTVSAEGRRGLSLGLRAVPLALAVGGAQAVSSRLVVGALGPEFPSLVGPLVGLGAALGLLRLRWLRPRSTWRVPVDAGGSGLGRRPEQPEGTSAPRPPSRAASFSPYLVLLMLLLLTRTRALPVQAWLEGVVVGTGPLLGTEIVGGFQPLHSPGAIFILAGVLSSLWLRGGPAMLSRSFAEAGRVTLKTAVALIAAIMTVRVFIHSGQNTEGFSAMPLVLAKGLAATFGDAWRVAAPWVGALGSFIAGSATFSNMLFALLQLEVALALDHPPTLILALQSAGSAAGNMVCIHNVVAACAIAGILGQEGAVIRRTAVPMVIYAVSAGALGLVL